MSAAAFAPTIGFARHLDSMDPLATYRDKFYIPEYQGSPSVYLCGNSLGLQPRQSGQYIQEVLDQWAKLGVEGHFGGEYPWFYFRNRSRPALAKLVGAKDQEVVAMNQLTTNLHLLMVSFYRPEKGKFKILTESGAFPSDSYVLESQARFHGFDPDEAIIEVVPRPGEHTLKTSDIIAQMENHKDELALVMFSGVQYYTGQRFDMATIAALASSYGIPVGLDLAHAIGNVPLHLHDWGVDFATWCSYKYLNAGPGNVSGIFVHEKHAYSSSLPRFSGWWGHLENERFEMKKGFKPMAGADGWLLSNDNVLGLAALQASLDLFDGAGLENLILKSEQLTGYLEFLLQDLQETGQIEIITPPQPSDRGAQLSICIAGRGKEVFESITEQGIMCDWRNPNVIRVAPAPLYNSFEDIYKFANLLRTTLRLPHAE